MIVGVPREIKDNENRVSMTPAGVHAFVKAGHTVLVETEAGVGSGFRDKGYEEAGATIALSAREVYSKSDMIIKVKEPLEAEYELLRDGQVLFTYLHLAAEPKLTDVLVKKHVLAIAYETIQDPDGSLPLLTPMSEVAGRMAVQIGAHYLEKPWGGSGVLLGGVPGVGPAEVVIIGGGTVGTNAAKMAIGAGARVTMLDINPERLRYLDDIFQGRVATVMSNPTHIAQAVKRADLLIGAVLIPGAKAPHLVTEPMVKRMKPGSVIVDVAIDQGGSIETIDHHTSHSDPVYERYGVIHYAVPNIPGAVPRTSTLALTNCTLPYALNIAKDAVQAIKSDERLQKGVNVAEGRVTYRAVAESLGLEFAPLDKVLF